MLRKRSTWLYGLPILVFWLAMMGWLWQREGGFQNVSQGTAQNAAPIESSDSWLALSLANGQRVGYIHALQQPARRHDLDGRSLDLQARMSLNLLGKATDLDISGSTWQAADGQRVDFEFAVRSGGHDLELSGQAIDGQLQGEVRSAGEVLPLELPVDSELVFGSGLGSAVQLPLLDIGEQMEIESLDPVTLSKSKWRLRCVAREVLEVGGRTVPTRVLEVNASGLESQVWIDDRGEVVRAETPLGLILERTTPAEALAPTDGGNAEDLLRLTAISPTGERPVRGASSLRIRLSGLPDGGLPEDAWQRPQEDGTVLIRTEATPSSPGEDDLAALLKPDVFVQSDHPKIIQQARAIVGEERDPRRQAERLHDWVYERLEKEAVISVPSALEVLETLRGDCNEHTVLYAALARAIDLPTRIAIGLVWSDELDGFYYHAWPEVFADEWLRLDPTLGQLEADATHLKLLSGGIESWPRLLPFLGKLEIEVLEITAMAIQASEIEPQETAG